MKRFKKELSWRLVAALVVSSLVVGLGQFGKILGQLGEYRDGFCRTAEVGEDQSAQEAALSVLRLARDVLIDFFKGLRQLVLFHQTLNVWQRLSIDEGNGRA